MSRAFCLLIGFLCVELVHGGLDACRGEGKDHLHRLVNSGLDGALHFVGGKLAKHVFYLIALGEVMPHTETESREVAVAKGLDDMIQAVMGTATPFGAHPEPARRQVDIIADNEDILLRDILALHPVSDGLATEVHVCGGHRQNQRASLVFAFGNIGVPIGAKCGRQLLRQCVHHLKTYIVAGPGILILRIPQPKNKELPVVFHLSKI